MNNAIKIYRLPILSATLVLAGLALLLVPSIRDQVATVPETFWSAATGTLRWIADLPSVIQSWF